MQVSGGYPVEIEPVVGKLNGLLEQREAMVERARSRAGNFAHSLKTPLTVIDTLLPELHAQGQQESAGEIGRQTAQLKKHVNRELARARMAAGHGEPVRDIAAALASAVRTRISRSAVLTCDSFSKPAVCSAICCFPFS